MNSHLTTEVVNNIAQSENDGGVFLKELAVGSRLFVQTKNTLYEIEKCGDDDFCISGNKNYCPDPVKAYIAGSTWGGSMLKVGFVGIGMHLEFSTKLHPGVTTTSTILSVAELS